MLLSRRTTHPAVPFTLFLFTDAAPTAIYPLSLHDALPISRPMTAFPGFTLPDELRLLRDQVRRFIREEIIPLEQRLRSEEHTSELQSHSDLVCRLLLEKKKTKYDLSTTGKAHHPEISARRQ